MNARSAPRGGTQPGSGSALCSSNTVRSTAGSAAAGRVESIQSIRTSKKDQIRDVSSFISRTTADRRQAAGRTHRGMRRTMTFERTLVDVLTVRTLATATAANNADIRDLPRTHSSIGDRGRRRSGSVIQSRPTGLVRDGKVDLSVADPAK